MTQATARDAHNSTWCTQQHVVHTTARDAGDKPKFKQIWSVASGHQSVRLRSAEVCMCEVIRLWAELTHGSYKFPLFTLYIDSVLTVSSYIGNSHVDLKESPESCY